MQKDLHSFLLGLGVFLIFSIVCIICCYVVYQCYKHGRLCYFRKFRKHNIEDLETIVIDSQIGINVQNYENMCDGQQII